MAEITPIADFVRRKGLEETADDLHLKKLAIQITAQLPDDPIRALAVLDHAETLVRTFLSEPKPA